jgi:hypothetical protein
MRKKAKQKRLMNESMTVSHADCSSAGGDPVLKNQFFFSCIFLQASVRCNAQKSCNIFSVGGSTADRPPGSKKVWLAGDNVILSQLKSFTSKRIRILKQIFKQIHTI